MILSFISLLFLTYCFSHYTASIQNLKTLKASFWSAAVTIANMTAVVQVVNDPVSIFGAIAGSLLGTYLSILQIKRGK